MPDPNKLKVLDEVNYRVQPCCRICQHGRFAPSSDYGQCSILTYEHEKPPGAPRPAPRARRAFAEETAGIVTRRWPLGDAHDEHSQASSAEEQERREVFQAWWGSGSSMPQPMV